MTDFSFDGRIRNERFGFRYSGSINIPVEGVYTFFVRSDDGSRLRIGDTLVVDNDGLHGSVEKKGEIALAAGLHPFTVDFFDQTGSEDLRVSIQGPGMKKVPIPKALLFH